MRTLIAALALASVTRLAHAQIGAVTAAAANGIYSKDENKISLLRLADDKLHVVFDLTHSYLGPDGPTAATGVAVGEAKLEGDTATYRAPGCTIRIQFLPGNQLGVTLVGENQCPFSPRTYVDGTYRKSKSGVPSIGGSDLTGMVTGKLGKNRPLAAALEDLKAVLTTIELNLSDAERSSRELAQANAEIQRLSERRRSEEAGVQAQRAEMERHLKSGAAAYQRYRQASPKQKQTPDSVAVKSLELARSEYETGLNHGKQVLRSVASLRTKEDELGKQLARSHAASFAVNLAAKDAASEITIARALERALSQAISRAGAEADPKAVAEQGAKLPHAQEQAIKARTLAASASTSAKQASTRAGLGSPDAYQVKRRRILKDDEKLAERLKAAGLVFLEVQANLAGSQVKVTPAVSGAKPGTSFLPFYPPRKDKPLRHIAYKPGDETALFKRMFGKFLGPNDDCTWQPGMRASFAQAQAAGQFQPSVLDAIEGALTKTGAKQRLLVIRMGECHASRAESFGTRRLVILDGAQIVTNVDGGLITRLGAADDLDGDGILDVVVESVGGGPDVESVTATLASFVGARFRQVRDFGETVLSPCNAMDADDSMTERITRVLVRPGPRPDFKLDPVESRCKR